SGPLPKAAALAEAKRWLRDLTTEEADRLMRRLRRGGRGGEVTLAPAARAARPYAHPYYWAGFLLIGDPGDVAQAVPVLAPAPPEAVAGPLPGQAPGPARWPWLVVVGLLLGVVGAVLAVRRR